MTPNDPDVDEDEDLLRLYRASANEHPDATLDSRVLRAVRALRARELQMPLLFAAAACLLIALVASLPGRRSVPPADTRTFGLYEGRTAALLGDPEAMRQMAIRQMRGASN